MSQSLIGKIQRNAEVRDIVYNLSKEYLWNLYIKQDGKCALTGIKLKLEKKYSSSNEASLDRINSKLPYIEGNVQWVHKYVNIMKRELPQEEFIKICKLVAQNNQ